MAARKTTKKAAGGKKAGAGATPKEPAKPAKVSSLSVNRGHLFALRPRVSAAFRPEDFLAAKRALEGEEYATIEEAARAVANHALALSNDLKTRPDFRPGR
jgi:hypothetical protein